MLITFSPHYSSSRGTGNAMSAVEETSKDQDTAAEVAWSKRLDRGQLQVRFQLMSPVRSGVPASSEAHDRVIKALLALDPGAEIRTAKGVFKNEVAT